MASGGARKSVLFCFVFFPLARCERNCFVVAVTSMFSDCIMQVRPYSGHRDGFVLPV